MMANHSAQYPDGYLDKETFKSFFAITGQSGSFQYQAGHERIPGKLLVFHLSTILFEGRKFTSFHTQKPLSN